MGRLTGDGYRVEDPLWECDMGGAAGERPERRALYRTGYGEGLARLDE